MNNITYDKSCDCMYINILGRRSVIDFTEEISPGIIVDYNKEGEVIGVELICLTQLMKENTLK